MRQRSNQAAGAGDICSVNSDDHRAFVDGLFRAHYDRLFRRFRRRVWDREVAADLTQEVFCLASQKVGLSSLENPNRYLTQIADNLLKDHIKYHSRTKRRANGHSDVDSVDVPSTEPSPEAAMQTRQELTIILQALEELPPKCQAVVVMHRLDGATYRQIAAHFGISQKMVEKYISRTLRHLSERTERLRSADRRAQAAE